MSNQSTSERIKEIAELEEKVTAMRNQLILEKLIAHSKAQESSEEKPKEFEFELKIETESVKSSVENNTREYIETDGLFESYNFITGSRGTCLIDSSNIFQLHRKQFQNVNTENTQKILDFCEQITHYENVILDCNSDFNFKVYPNKLIIVKKMYHLVKNIKVIKKYYNQYLQEPNIVTFDLVKK